MASKEKKQESVIIKIYLIILFLCGIGIWFAVQSAPKEKIAIDIEIDKKVVDVLVANGVKQEDILSQFAKEMETRTAVWNEFYKKIRLKGDKKPENFENGFRAIARSFKVGLSKSEKADGSIIYRFYVPNRNYSNITFVMPMKPSRLKGEG